MLYRLHRIRNYFERIKIFKNWWSFIWPLNRFGKEKLAVLRKNNAKLLLRNGEVSDFAVMVEVFGRDDYRFESLKNPSIIMDIGAHIGGFVVSAALNFPQAKIYSFEPVEENYKMLIKNIRLNNLTNVFAFNKAIMDKSGDSYIYLNPKNKGAHTTLADLGTGKQKITSITLQEFIENEKITKIDFLKMDIEGAEFDVLMNCPKQILLLAERMGIEIHHKPPHPRYTKNDLLNLLNGFFTITQSADDYHVYTAIKK